jgi:hypothetical protein
MRGALSTSVTSPVDSTAARAIVSVARAADSSESYAAKARGLTRERLVAVAG